MAKRSKQIDPVNIRASIKSAFEASGMTQVEFSRRANTTPAKVSEFFNKGTQPRMESLERMMNVLGLEVRAGR